MQRSTSNALPARVRNLGRERAPQHGTPGRTRGVELGARESLELGQVPERHLREVVVLAVVFGKKKAFDPDRATYLS